MVSNTAGLRNVRMRNVLRERLPHDVADLIMTMEMAPPGYLKLKAHNISTYLDQSTADYLQRALKDWDNVRFKGDLSVNRGRLLCRVSNDPVDVYELLDVVCEYILDYVTTDHRKKHFMGYDFEWSRPRTFLQCTVSQNGRPLLKFSRLICEPYD